jgi:excisionase family DNA binding protein
VSSRDPEGARADGAGEQQTQPSGVVRLGAAAVASRRAPARASSRRTGTDADAADALAAARPVTLEVLNQRIEALTAAVERLTPPELVSVAQSARQLGVSARTIRRWVRARQIPFVKLGNTVRIDLTAVRATPAGHLQRQIDVARRLVPWIGSF